VSPISTPNRHNKYYHCQSAWNQAWISPCAPPKPHLRTAAPAGGPPLRPQQVVRFTCLRALMTGFEICAFYNLTANEKHSFRLILRPLTVHFMIWSGAGIEANNTQANK
jgi:hypothetical protein